MATCVRCHKDVGFLGSVNFNKHTQRCSSCEKQTKEALERFRLTFLNYCKSGALTSQAWANLQAGAANDQLNMNEALLFIKKRLSSSSPTTSNYCSRRWCYHRGRRTCYY